MLEKIIAFSVNNKLIVILFTITVAAFGLYAVYKIPVGAVPDITNNQVQVITTSGNLSTQEIEQFITAPVEMEMANLPGVQEIRSISKFGISLVTVVFDEEMGTYLPRQLIAEKIKSATGKIPEGFGEPEMGPITTGLGEIYQYIVDVKPGFEDQYTASDLRTIQDWVIKRRLSGINGVVEINSWGGYLKQYEIAIDPLLLRSFNISLLEVFEAVQANNSISGGSYIEKANQSYFIRGDGQVTSLTDIGNIMVTNRAGTPILVKDIANVRFGHANRYGAITANGKGETVLGQIMMLKDANSKEVINEVKKRVQEIQENLPEGVFINPIIERSELIDKTSFTVSENLILGALIVMLIVILIMGNIRSAIVIASMIPLALLFTISAMYVLGIDANLMSLGALDFGIIIDGAVIIVEYIVIKLTIQNEKINTTGNVDRATLIDKISVAGASKMMKSALFGQVIILIVFIPILSLSGVEGKMFRPMALSFSFAIIGAMIFGLTWLPVAASLFLRPEKSTKPNFSDKLMTFIKWSYLPAIKWSCGHKKIVLGAAVASLILTVFLFGRIGGEFVPTLDEGDFVIQPVLKTGTSLSKTVLMTTQMENILIKEFPEVDQIVSRIGAAEVPTDPMSMEEIDMIIKLKPRKTWTSAKTKEELADKFKEALMVIPGVEYEFTQPIEMRFNELITGVRSDIAIKIFGEDLDYINQKAIEIKNVISNIDGAEDIILEKTAGLPQIKITYDRQKITHFGLSMQTLNKYLSTAFGGQFTGVVFEGEKRFDVVLRLSKENRTDLHDIEQIQIPVSATEQIPMSKLATIEYTEGPAKISRENTHRRVVVSVNVRNRDLQSVINDIRNRIETNVNLEPGTYVEYGGQFENLNNATRRLTLAVPIALLLIFIFLHFAFQSLRDAFMIFTAIPLATVGGVMLLWLRGMPFSVSAGVGFIALFGIAVLNGIVLIEHLKELRSQGLTDMKALILQGTIDRLRPVLLTAGAAAMGFLPMAISTGAGAEVQRPLATVVIGGLVTSTMLTLIALPLLFTLFYNPNKPKLFRFLKTSAKSTLPIILMMMASLPLMGQQRKITLTEAVSIAVNHNKAFEASRMKVQETKILKGTAYDFDKTLIAYSTDQNNIAENGYPLHVWSIEQSFNFPGVYVAQSKVKTSEYKLAEINLKIDEMKLKKEVSKSYLETQILNKKQLIYEAIDTLFSTMAQQYEIKFKTGEIPYLELLNIKAQKRQAHINSNNIKRKLENAYINLQTLLNTDSSFLVTDTLSLIVVPEDAIRLNPTMAWWQTQQERNQSALQLEKNKLLPDFFLNYFIGTNNHPNAGYYNGFQVGIYVPFLFKSQRAKIGAASIALDADKMVADNTASVLISKERLLRNEQRMYGEQLENDRNEGQMMFEELEKTAKESYKNGEINFFSFATSMENAYRIKLEHLDNILNYNILSIELLYLTIQ